jgi:hypothetical protein
MRNFGCVADTQMMRTNTNDVAVVFMPPEDDFAVVSFPEVICLPVVGKPGYKGPWEGGEFPLDAHYMQDYKCQAQTDKSR